LGYFVSDYGEIISVKQGSAKFLNPVKRTSKNRTIFKINLRRECKTKTYRVHRLVAFAFVPGYQEGLTVNHKDGDTLNNRASNLEWLPLADNIRHAWDGGFIGKHPNYYRKGENGIIRSRR